MARGRIVSPVDGKDDWYFVKDDLGDTYEVESAVKGFNYTVGEQYRIFAPGGLYKPSKFRLLPYKTSKRWNDISELGKTSPATAVAHYMYGEKMLSETPQDETRVVKAISYGTPLKEGRALFIGGGCAAIPEGDEDLYADGDCVAVIRDVKEFGDDDCLLSYDDEPWVAGFGCKQSPRSSCAPLLESWDGYGIKKADLAEGVYIFEKESAGKNEIKWWKVAVSDVYVSEGGPNGLPYGSPAKVTANGYLSMESAIIEMDDISGALNEELMSIYPAPIYSRMILGSPAVISPPVTVSHPLGRNLRCGGRHLKMEVNLVTEDTHGHYTSADGDDNTGLQLPSCLVLTFSASPYPNYLDGKTINPKLFGYSVNGLPLWASVEECNLDKNFKLVYAAPGMRDFDNLRSHLSGSVDGRYGLYTALPRRLPGGGYWKIILADQDDRSKFNIPMSDHENGFEKVEGLMSRVFNTDGADKTPTPRMEGAAGVFPGFFEISSRSSVTRDIHEDFLAAYPFMANDVINVSGKLPRLKEVTFYVQGKVYPSVVSNLIFHANQTRLECREFYLFY
jgi:hypothetical protein